jgi:hypothetical protein
MEECIQKMELQGKELNPETCVFVKKCPEGQMRNEKGRCVKSKKQRTPNVAPQYVEGLKKPKREIPGEGKVKFVRRKKSNIIHLNNETEKRGPPHPRLRKTARLYANASNWHKGHHDLRNSLSIEADKRGMVVIPQVRKTRAKKERSSKNYGISFSPNSVNVKGPYRQQAENNLGLAFDIEHGGEPKLLRKISGNKTPNALPSPNENQLMGMYEAQQPPVNTRRLQRRKAKNKAAKAKQAEEKAKSANRLSQNAAVATKAGLAI